MARPIALHMIIAPIVACALFMENLDSTIIATALPRIAASLHEDPLRLNLAITSYLISLAVFLPLSGWLADRQGARDVFRSAILVFTAGSIACGFSHSLWQLVAARIVQGMGGAMMVPVGRLVLLRVAPKTDLLRALNFLVVPAMIGPTIGPPLGGFIVTYATWRWIFFINVPVGIVGVILVSLLIDNQRGEDDAPLDLKGFALIGFALGGLIFGFEAASRSALPAPLITAMLTGGTLCALLYVRHARQVKNPIIDFALFRIPSYAIVTLGGSLFRMGIGGLPFLLPLLMQVGFGLSAFVSGLLTFASAAGALTMRLIGMPIIRRYGFRRVLIANAVISGLFGVSYALFRPDTPHLALFIVLLTGGFFRSMEFACINTLSYADIPAALMSRATTISSMVQQLTVSMGVAISALLLQLILYLAGSQTLGAGDFPPVFLILGLMVMGSAVLFIPLAEDAGAEVSGHRGGPAQMPASSDHPAD